MQLELKVALYCPGTQPAMHCPTELEPVEAVKGALDGHWVQLVLELATVPSLYMLMGQAEHLQPQKKQLREEGVRKVERSIVSVVDDVGGSSSCCCC